jgi:membrane-associated phospholipid phosphatase
MAMNPVRAAGVERGPGGLRRLLSVAFDDALLKFTGMSGFIALFFVAYIYLLRHPAFPVQTMPLTWVDDVVPYEPLAFFVYASLWFYVSLPLFLSESRREMLAFGARMATLCLVGLAIFFFWPTAIPAPSIDWHDSAGLGFLKHVDAAGNACPSLHVATAVTAAFCLRARFARFGLPTSAGLANGLWCAAIAYSTLATKQHVAVDVLAGAALGAVFAQLDGAASRWRARNRQT